MPVVKIEPSDEHPVPFSTDAEEPQTFADAVTVAANTADLLVGLGAPLEVDVDNVQREKKLIDDVIRNQKTKPLRNTTTAFAASAFLKEYGQSLAFDVSQVRAALTNKLLEIADCGEIKYELKALELLGKHSDIGLFTERSEITINYKSPEDLENAIKERVKRLLNADVIDVTPLGANLDEELGVAGPLDTSSLLAELNAVREEESEESEENEEADDGEA